MKARVNVETVAVDLRDLPRYDPYGGQDGGGMNAMMMNPMMNPMMMNEVEIQFIHMAQGGDGSAAEMGDIRTTYYSGWDDTFFQLICDGMDWDWR